MTFLRLSAAVVACLVLAAHLLRAGGTAAAAVALLLPFLLLVRRPWAVRALQVALLVGALEWLRTLLALVDLRRAHGQPYLRLALILGAVALVTAGAAALLQGWRRGPRGVERLGEAAS